MSARTEQLKVLVDGLPWGDWPQLYCPACGDKSLTFSSEPTIWESRESKLAKDHEAWEPTWIHGPSVGQLRCARAKCGEGVLVTGPGRVTEKMDGRNWYGDHTVHLTPNYFEPELIAIELPESCPEAVARMTLDASRVIWTDPSAAVNRVRAAEEALLTARGVRRERVVNRKRRRLTLHDRLEEFERKSPDSAKFLMAVKWLGNDASHRDVISAHDAWEAMELFELALQLVLNDRTAELNRRAAQIIRRKGVARR